MTELPRGFNYAMKSELRFGASLEWRYWVEGKLGACEFWVRESPYPDKEIVHPEEKFYGGFEVHSGDGEGVPDYGRCPMMSERPCWHDGSSTYASEFWIPRWMDDPSDSKYIWSLLVGEYRRRFEQEDEENGDC